MNKYFLAFLISAMVLIECCNPNKSISSKQFETLINQDTSLYVHPEAAKRFNLKNDQWRIHISKPNSDTAKVFFYKGKLSPIKVRVWPDSHLPVFLKLQNARLDTIDLRLGIFGVTPFDSAFTVEIWRDYGKLGYVDHMIFYDDEGDSLIHQFRTDYNHNLIARKTFKVQLDETLPFK